MIIRLAVKTGLAAGAVYESKKLGVWSNFNDTEKLSKEMCALTSPYMAKVKKSLPFEIPLLPKRGEIRFLAKHYYNLGVKSSIHFIYMLPCYTGQLIKKTKDMIVQATEPKANAK